MILSKEILKHNPDIGCLEEVDCFHLIKEELNSHGYQGFFVPKPKSPCLKYKVMRYIRFNKLLMKSK